MNLLARLLVILSLGLIAKDPYALAINDVHVNVNVNVNVNVGVLRTLKNQTRVQKVTPQNYADPAPIYTPTPLWDNKSGADDFFGVLNDSVTANYTGHIDSGFTNPPRSQPSKDASASNSKDLGIRPLKIEPWVDSYGTLNDQSSKKTAPVNDFTLPKSQPSKDASVSKDLGIRPLQTDPWVDSYGALNDQSSKKSAPVNDLTLPKSQPSKDDSVSKDLGIRPLQTDPWVDSYGTLNDQSSKKSAPVNDFTLPKSQPQEIYPGYLGPLPNAVNLPKSEQRGTDPRFSQPREIDPFFRPQPNDVTLPKSQITGPWLDSFGTLNDQSSKKAAPFSEAKDITQTPYSGFWGALNNQPSMKKTAPTSGPKDFGYLRDHPLKKGLMDYFGSLSQQPSKSGMFGFNIF
ncbi:maker687 [Drosophila busckii]|uniref:Maker687 n=1 Tax=Drosophila busckii TaxID=30019 RepID=A0A0M4EIQ5_DROBS|nr:maker687 [Drosophila busckii]